MSQIYLFCLVLGGGLAALSVLGDVLDFGGEVDVDAMDVDASELDALDGASDLDVDADAGLLDAGAEGGDAAADALDGLDAESADAEVSDPDAPDADAEKVFSIRGLVYGLFGFGLAGSVLGWTGQPPAGPTTIVFSGLAGAGSGWVTTRIVNWLRTSGAGERQGESSFEGRPGRVVLPVEPGSPGRVKVRRGEREYALRALPYDPDAADAGSWEEVVVVEMRSGVAYVSPLDDADDLRLSS